MDRAAGANIEDAARGLFRILSERGLRLACAESCTGGMVTSAITDIPGSSAVLWGGVVAYSNECKMRLLGVPRTALAEYGAVSREVAREMARGALEAAEEADIALAISGIAGPDGGSREKPVGLVWFAFRKAGIGAEGIRNVESFEESRTFAGDRNAVREAAAAHAMLRAAELARGFR